VVRVHCAMMTTASSDPTFRPPFAPEVMHAPASTPALRHAEAALLLRNRPEAWHKLVAGAAAVGQTPLGPQVGSLALALWVILDGEGRAFVCGCQGNTAVARGVVARALVTAGGLDPGAAHARATVLTATVQEHNAPILRAAYRVVSGTASGSGGGCPGPPAGDLTLVARVALLPLWDVMPGPTSAWFRTSHANALVARRGAVVVVEPSAPASAAPTGALLAAIRAAIGMGPGTAVVGAAGARWAPIADLALCTLGVGVLALTLVANVNEVEAAEAVAPPQQPRPWQPDAGRLTALVNWVHAHQHWLLRLLCRALDGAGASTADPSS
jgi:hypothetical protein